MIFSETQVKNNFHNEENITELYFRSNRKPKARIFIPTETPLNALNSTVGRTVKKLNMSPRLKVSDFILQRLRILKEESSGFLLGINDDDIIYALGISKQLNPDGEKENDDTQDLNNYDLIPNLPASINFCGVFNVVSGNKPNNNIINDLCKRIKVTPVVLHFDLSSKEFTTYIYDEGVLNKIEHEVVQEKDLLNSFLHLQLTASIPLSCDFQNETLEEAFDFIQKKITDGNSAFHVQDSNIYIFGEKPSDISGISPEASIEKLYSTLKENDEKKKENGINVINVTLYLKGTDNEKTPQLAPLIKYVKKIYKHIGIQISIDSLAITPIHLQLQQLYPILVESALRSLELNKKTLLSELESNEVRSTSLPVTYHFFPQHCGHFISIVYPANPNSEQFSKTRETFHLLLSLPMDRPLFRKGNAFDFSSSNNKHSSNLILNPHEGLSSSGVPDGECSLVQGTYAYHHYMQDKFDDNGWGCAYRSLQTIISWFRFQGYTNMAVPTHKEIQQCLVNIGDKPSSFVGSKQWIGSTEVSFVLDTMLGVTCRIVNVSSGEEMSMKGGELTYHFKTQGTPIMIGGGVLAHTILGVDYNNKTGAIKFLILDPHYTGEEDLKIIQSKGWCGWKGPDFWKKNAFYNMCLPLRPKCV